MAQITFSVRVRMDENLKRPFDLICQEIRNEYNHSN